MNCVIPGANLKVISKALQSLAKIGDELSIEAKPEHLSFVTLNQTKTTFAIFKFQEIFFSSYVCGRNAKKNNGNDPNILCRIHLKAMLNIFKSVKEKKIEYCKIELAPDDNRILFIFKYKQDIVIKHHLRLIDGDYTDLNYETEGHSNVFACSGSFLNSLFSNFQTSDTDLSLEVVKKKITARNFYQASNNVLKSIRSHVILTSQEFSTYHITEETSITLSLKPFRSIVTFAESLLIPVSIQFDKGGEPLVITVKSSTFQANFILATIDPLSGETQTTMSIPQLLSESRPPSQHDITVEDRDALVSINWDKDDFDFEPHDNFLPVKKQRTSLNNNNNSSKSELNKSERHLPTINPNLEKDNQNFDKNNPINNRILPEFDPKVINIQEDRLGLDDEIEEKRSESRKLSDKLRYVFARCFEEPINESFGELLAPNSDSD